MKHQITIATTDTRDLEGVSPGKAEAILANTSTKFCMPLDEFSEMAAGGAYRDLARGDDRPLGIS